LYVAGASVRAEPSILVSSHFTWEILRYDGVTGEFVGVHVPRGRLLNNTGISVSGNDLFVACHQTDSILRFDLQTGAFIDVYVKPQSGGLWNPAHFSINSGEGGVFGAAVASARAADGNLYVMSKDRDAVLRFGGTALLQMAASGSAANALLCYPGGSCPGPRADPNERDIYGQPVADFIPGDPIRLQYPMKPAWDAYGDMHTSFPARPCGTEGRRGAAMRFYPDTGYPKPSDCDDNTFDEFVTCESGQLHWPSRGVLGPDGNLYLGSGMADPECELDALRRTAARRRESGAAGRYPW